MVLGVVTRVLDSKFKASMKDKNFKKFLEGYDCAVVMKTRNNRSGKRFVFKNGTFWTDNVLDEFDSALVFKDNLAAIKAFSGGGDQAVMEAVQKHNAAILGSVGVFNWFGSAMNYVMGRTRER